MLFPDEKNPVPEKRKATRSGYVRPGSGPKPAPMKSEAPAKKKHKKES